MTIIIIVIRMCLCRSVGRLILVGTGCSGFIIVGILVVIGCGLRRFGPLIGIFGYWNFVGFFGLSCVSLGL